MGRGDVSSKKKKDPSSQKLLFCFFLSRCLALHRLRRPERDGVMQYLEVSRVAMCGASLLCPTSRTAPSLHALVLFPLLALGACRILSSAGINE